MFSQKSFPKALPDRFIYLKVSIFCLPLKVFHQEVKVCGIFLFPMETIENKITNSSRISNYRIDNRRPWWKRLWILLWENETICNSADPKIGHRHLFYSRWFAICSQIAISTIRMLVNNFGNFCSSFGLERRTSWIDS